MPDIKQLAQELPDAPEMALLMFAKRASDYYVSMTDEFSASEAVFIYKCCSRLIQRFDILINDTEALDQDIHANRSLALSLINAILASKSKLIEYQVESDVEDIVSQFEPKTENSFGYARLNSDEKLKVLDHIERIRIIIDASTLSVRKKDVLFERLATLISEVNRAGTRTDRFFAFAGDVGFVLGDFAQKAKPLIDEIKDVLKIVGRSRARQEGITLPPGDEVLRLPSPDLATED